MNQKTCPNYTVSIETHYKYTDTYRLKVGENMP